MKRTTVFTCSIYPDLTRVWYHFVRRYTDPSAVTTVIYDCGSRLRAEHFPGARIVRHRNVEHGIKIDHCVRETVETPLLFLSDDDTFILSEKTEPRAASALMDDERAAAFSYKPRGWWEWEIGAERHPVMGSYSLVFKPEIFRSEELSFKSRPTKDPRIGNDRGYYDTADWANEQLLNRGYRVVTIPDDERNGLLRSYSAVSSGFVNFARRRWFRDGYVLATSRDALETKLRASKRELERACGVAAARLLYRGIFDEPPAFDDFIDYDELLEIARALDAPEQRDDAVEMVDGYRKLFRTLQEAT
jgi:hypothetical protein